MSERVYEGMYLLDANRYARDSSNVSGRIGGMIEKCGGEVLVSRLWAEQKLAYTINGNRKGAYWLVYFKLDKEKLGDLRRAAQLNNDVLRDLVLAVDPRLVDTLVAHASSGDKSVEPAAPAADSPAADSKEPTADSPAADSPAADSPAADSKEPAVETKGGE